MAVVPLPLSQNAAARALLQKLQASIEGSTCAVLGIAHTNKKPDLRAIERIIGTVAFANFVSSVLLVSRDKDDEEWFRLVHAKHNLSVRGDDLLLCPKYIGPYDQSVLLEWKLPELGNAEPDAVFDRKPKANGLNSDRLSAGQWLVAYLKTNGETLRADIISAGENAGYTERGLRGAQVRNNRIRSRQDTFHGPFVWWFE